MWIRPSRKWVLKAGLYLLLKRPIDFDGSVFYFPDLANRRIYTKQINMDGTASLNVYELKNEPVVSSPQYVTREEFETTLAQLKQAMLGKEPESQPAPAQPQQTEKFKF